MNKTKPISKNTQHSHKKSHKPKIKSQVSNTPILLPNQNYLTSYIQAI